MDAPILFVDDDEAQLVLLRRILERQGYRALIPCSDPREVPELVRRHDVDLLIADLRMPGTSGLDLIERVLADRPEGDWFPIAVLTADIDPATEQEALRRGANDFITKPFEPGQIQLRVRNLLRTRTLHVALREQNERLENLVRERTLELDTARMDLLERLTLAAEFRDYVTGRHIHRVAELAALLAERLGLPSGRVELLRRAAPLHDVGKIGIPDRILLKPGRLDPEEFATMQEHVGVGVHLLARGRSELLVMAEEIALTHHERWDGSGYPRGLAGDEIPLVGQIVAIADVFDTLVNDRPYKAAWPVEKAVAEVRRRSGHWFAPQLVETFLGVLASNAHVLLRIEREAREDAPPLPRAGTGPAPVWGPGGDGARGGGRGRSAGGGRRPGEARYDG